MRDVFLVILDYIAIDPEYRGYSSAISRNKEKIMDSFLAIGMSEDEIILGDASVILRNYITDLIDGGQFNKAGFIDYDNLKAWTSHVYGHALPFVLPDPVFPPNSTPLPEPDAAASLSGISGSAM